MPLDGTYALDMACATCRARKIKCDRTLPICQNCKLRSSHCTYAGERRKRRWTNSGIEDARIFVSYDGNRVVRHRDTRPEGTDIQEMPALLESIDNGPNHTEENEQTIIVAQADGTSDGSHCAPHAEGASVDQRFQSPFSINVDSNRQPLKADDAGGLLDDILSGNSTDSVQNRHPAVWMRTDEGDEYTGPSSGIATISDLGLNWIRDHIPGSHTLCSTILDIRNSVLSHLRQPKCVRFGPCSSPGAPLSLKAISPPDIRKYVEAYFSTVQIIFPILDRADFETQLATYGTEPGEGSFSWKALLNAVLASGCRAALSDETAEAFQVSGREAWDYFQNALYYESKMIHAETDLLAVKALAVMTVFAQGMSSPQRLEYTLSSAASRLAQSLALNHRPPPEWALTESEQRERNRIFWVVYCLDKTIALRCGRPPVIHDDEISCSFPHGLQVVQGGDLGTETTAQGQSFDFFLCLTKLARICGTITHELYSASALHSPSSQLHAKSTKILRNVESWRHSLPTEIQPGKPFGRVCGIAGPSRTQLLVLHYSYYYVLCAIYRRFTPMFTQGEKEAWNPVSESANISHIEAARSMVLLTRYLDIESFTPGWLMFYYPFTALTTIFMHVVCSPPDDSIQNDIALMEVIVGFFGRLEYITSGEAAFTKTTEFVRQARSVLRTSSTPTGPHSQSSGPDNNHRRQCRALSLERQTNTDESMGVPTNYNDEAGGSHQILPRPTMEVSAPAISEAVTANLELQGDHRSSSPDSYFTNIAGILALPSGEISDEHWLGDWISASQNAHPVS
ncbi:fungal-specific transcription factor domain-containing protein [Ilyonectria sp. MPI-CAGE-AT-0026]|nr:fungal-specific transcription factor domain-containing protein [Ilyonectria sp. MPI-CAGE-AT-0026]